MLFSPSTIIDSVAAIVIVPPSPNPEVSVEIKPPFVNSNEVVAIVISPASPTASEFVLLVIELDSPVLFSPSTIIDSVAAIAIFPPSPNPEVSVEIKPPFVNSNEVVPIAILPASANVSEFLSPVIELDSPLRFSPSTTTDSASVIVISPPSPNPEVSVEIKPPFVNSNEVVVMSILPASPARLKSVSVLIELLVIELDSPALFSLSITTDSLALIVILPAIPNPSTSLVIRPPFVTSNILVLISISDAIPCPS